MFPLWLRTPASDAASPSGCLPGSTALPPSQYLKTTMPSSRCARAPWLKIEPALPVRDREGETGDSEARGERCAWLPLARAVHSHKNFSVELRNSAPAGCRSRRGSGSRCTPRGPACPRSAGDFHTDMAGELAALLRSEAIGE